MNKTILKNVLLGMSLLYVGSHCAVSAPEGNDEQQRANHPVSQKEKEADATPGDIKKFFGKVQETKEKTSARAEKAKPALKEAGEEIEQAAKDTGKAFERAISGLAGRRDDKPN